MYQWIIVGIVLLTIIILIGLIKKVFGVIFKIAFFLLCILLIGSALLYIDLYTNDLLGETHVLLANNETFVQGYVLNNGRINDTIILEAYNITQARNETNLIVIAHGNFSEQSNIPFFRNQIGLIRAFRNDRLEFYPKTLSLSIIERIHS